LAKNSRFADLYEVFWNRFFGSRKTKISQKGGLSLVFDSHGKLQVSYFVDIANLVPNSDVYIKLLGLFEEEGFLPATIQEMVHELPRPFPRISLCSKDGHFAINFLTKRVIIERSSTDQESSSVSSFANQIKDIISKLERFIQKKASRIAFVTSGLLKEKGKDTLNKVYGCLFKPLPFYEKETPFEWYSRSVARYTIEIGASEEDVNVVTSINRIQGTFIDDGLGKQFDRIEVAFDINTLSERVDERFDVVLLADFVAEAIEIRSRIIDQIESEIDA